MHEPTMESSFGRDAAEDTSTDVGWTVSYLARSLSLLVGFGPTRRMDRRRSMRRGQQGFSNIEASHGK